MVDDYKEVSQEIKSINDSIKDGTSKLDEYIDQVSYNEKYVADGKALIADAITEKGIAGRLGSLIVSERFEPRKREYTDIYEYCTRCGACIRRCPAGAISLENGKEHLPCDQFLEETKKKYAPRYGCGKCQTKVPCESRIPGKRG